MDEIRIRKPPTPAGRKPNCTPSPWPRRVRRRLPRGTDEGVLRFRLAIIFFVTLTLLLISNVVDNEESRSLRAARKKQAKGRRAPAAEQE